jgi:hypothetical protein
MVVLINSTIQPHGSRETLSSFRDEGTEWVEECCSGRGNCGYRLDVKPKIHDIRFFNDVILTFQPE